MLAVLLGILKIIGLVLLAVLLLVLLVLALVLLVPVRYTGRGEWEEAPRVQAGVSWLLHLVSLRVIYDGSLRVRLRLFGFYVRELVGDGETAAEEEEASGGKAEKNEISQTVPSENEFPRQVLHEDIRTETVTEENQFSERIREKEPAPKKKNRKPEDVRDVVSGDIVLARRKSFASLRNSLMVKIRGIFSGILSRVREVARGIREKVTGLLQKKELVLDFWHEEKNRATLSLLKRQIFRLLRHVRPRKMKGRVRFGFDDPYTTGQILTVVSPFYGWYAKNVQIIPVFDGQALDGELVLRGRICIGAVLLTAGRMLFDKNFRGWIKWFLRRA
ncbi:MAG: DUF2953 domain-containing protein [Clostridiales bacterium]|nr:DUF2953 domain-containing protein [Clostridiales bacterium]